ncbi:type ISP restriction/modification enzyme [Phormidesmis sp. 146-12]
MSRLLITQYHAEVQKIIQYGGSRNEGAISGAFFNLLNEYCKTRDFVLIGQLEYPAKNGKMVRPDGTVKDALRLDWGFWESKDEDDNLDEEIRKKFAKGYPNDNILFEDSQMAVLIQAGQEVSRVLMKDADSLDRLLNAFINYVRPEVKSFREAIESFKGDLPTIVETLRSLLQQQDQTNAQYQQSRDQFWQICQDSINPAITLLDVQEMIIQHILTEDIFLTVFSESQFHRDNNVARELNKIIDTFFTKATRKNTLSSIDRYYTVIKQKAASIANHHEKQKFLKVVYENFYKAYNPKAADRLGIVYTPNEIVRFMIESVDYLLHKHFNKLLADPGVKVLDPATGTGTYITELIEYLPHDKLKHKYQHEIFCNEVGILPYYIANLNIEFTYQQKMGEYEEFQNICFVDTLDHTSFEGKQGDLFAMSIENTERIKRQNDQEIFVVIGNPPYNANQANENDNNKNRAYQEIDKRIKATYIKHSKAQKTKLYDMYSRFFRWASDRLGKNGILAFVTNSSFVDTKNFDGFRKVVSEEFSDIYIVDLGGNVRANPKLSGTKNNVFGIQTGVAISFMIRKNTESLRVPCRIHHSRKPESETSQEKLEFLVRNKFRDISFSNIQPDGNNNWINVTYNDFDDLLSFASNSVKKDTKNEDTSLFKIFTLGNGTNRDEWVYDFDTKNLEKKIISFYQVYEDEKKRWKASDKSVQINDFVSREIKWTSELESHLIKGTALKFNHQLIRDAVYRPFVKKKLYYDKVIIHRQYQTAQVFPTSDIRNQSIWLKIGTEVPMFCVAIDSVPDLLTHGGAQCFPLYRYEKDGTRIENITDWGLTQFQTHYNDPKITKQNIFHYTYAVLHHPAYRAKYEFNLKREFPRLPFYDNFAQWVTWGEQLMELHIGYETVEAFGLVRKDEKNGEAKTPKARLKADKANGVIILDDITRLDGIPAIAWDYKLGNRSALEWILDQYKEKKPKDPTIAAKFNTYRFADYKEQVIDLLQRVCTVSVETITIIQQMPEV